MRLYYFLWVLTTLFVFRVAAQLMQATIPVSFLPPFQTWDSGLLPYPLLLVSQALIIVALVVVTRWIQSNTLESRPWKYRACFIFGGLYFSVMGFRLAAGLTVLNEHPWFSKSIPAFFHLVLASFILLMGWHLLEIGRGQEQERSATLIKAGR